MKTKILSLIAALAIVPVAHLNAELPPKQEVVVTAYTLVSDALVADNLSEAKAKSDRLIQAAKYANDDALAKAAMQLSVADSLDAARSAFKDVSQELISITKGEEGYYVMNCPMAKADWVQTDKEIQNPYMGQKMVACGMIKEDSHHGSNGSHGHMDHGSQKGMHGQMSM